VRPFQATAGVILYRTDCKHIKKLRHEPRGYCLSQFQPVVLMNEIRDEFLSEEDLDLANMPYEELEAWWNLWLEQAQITNDEDKDEYSHGVFCSMNRE
jgi:hypothetical protein